MSRSSVPIVEDLPEPTDIESLSMRSFNPLRDEWRTALVSRVLRYNVRLGGRPLDMVSWPHSLLGSDEAIEETSTSYSVLITGTGLLNVGSTTLSLTIFPQSSSGADLIGIATEVGQRHEPVVKGKGVPVWILVSYAKKRGMTPREISQLWNGDITEQEVMAALAYSRAHPEAVEDKLAAEE